jgi:glycosyltransferase involved in cell wall biosynthesis
MSISKAVIIPSIWYEMFPITMIEALSVGAPIIASKIGALAFVVKEGINGAHFEAGNASNLASSVLEFESLDDLSALSKNARKEWHSLYSPDVGMVALNNIYEDLIRA